MNKIEPGKMDVIVATLECSVDKRVRSRATATVSTRPLPRAEVRPMHRVPDEDYSSNCVLPPAVNKVKVCKAIAAVVTKTPSVNECAKCRAAT